MPHTRVLFASQAREKTLSGVNTLAEAVRVTLGRKSKCVLQRRFGAPLVCNDGVTIAREMHLDDPSEDLGAQMIRQAAERTGDAVGDGTSTATVLAQATSPRASATSSPAPARSISSAGSIAARAWR